MFDVNPKNADTLKLKGRSPGGVQWGVALVGRDRRPDHGHRRRASPPTPERTTSTSVTLQDAQSFDRITAVVTNADGHVTGLQAQGLDGVQLQAERRGL